MRYILATTSLLALLTVACSHDGMKPDGPLAGRTIAVADEIPYQAGAAPSALVSGCNLQGTLPLDLQDRAARHKLNVVVIDKQRFLEADLKLGIKIISAYAADRTSSQPLRDHGIGQFITTDNRSEQYLRIHGFLVDHDKVIGTFKIRDTVSGGPDDACGVLHELSKDVAKRVADFLDAPSINFEQGL